MTRSAYSVVDELIDIGEEDYVHGVIVRLMSIEDLLMSLDAIDENLIEITSTPKKTPAPREVSIDAGGKPRDEKNTTPVPRPEVVREDNGRIALLGWLGGSAVANAIGRSTLISPNHGHVHISATNVAAKTVAGANIAPVKIQGMEITYMEDPGTPDRVMWRVVGNFVTPDGGWGGLEKLPILGGVPFASVSGPLLITMRWLHDGPKELGDIVPRRIVADRLKWDSVSGSELRTT